MLKSRLSSSLASDRSFGSLHQRAIMALVSAALFMEILDGTIITTALPAMARSFATTPVALDIGVSAYLLAVGVFVPASGWVADRFGARVVFAGAIALFTAISALCGLATGPTEFVVLRVVQGMAGAMMVPVGRLVVMRATPREKLVETMAALVWPALFAPVLGPPIGGLITEHLGWRWIFYLNLPFGLIALGLSLWLVPDARGERRRFDHIGFAISSLGLFLFQLGLEHAARHLDLSVLAEIAAGLVLIIAAIAHWRRVPHPLLDPSAYAIATFRVAVRGGTVMRLAVNAAPFLLPLMLQAGYGFSAFHAGLFVLMLFAGDMTMKAFVTRLLRRHGHRRVLLANGVVCVITMLGCAAITPELPLPLTGVILFVHGMARSLQFTSLATLAFSDVDRDAMGNANTLFNTITLLAGAAGITAGAMAVHAGADLAGVIGLHGAGSEYRFAFIALSALACAGLLDLFGLPHGAGRSVVGN